MIIVRLMGGLGNQMFQYATGRSLATKRKTDLMLDSITYFENQPAENTPREYELNSYPLSARIATQGELKKFFPNDYFKEARLEKLKKSFGLNKKLVIYNELGLGYHPEVLKLPNNSYLNGFWQNEKYFIDIRGALLKEFEPTTPLTQKGMRYLEKIKACEAVSLHIRRDDYISNKYANKFHGLAPLEYYHTAFNFIRKKLPEKSIEMFVFSTDIAWCKKNLKFSVPITFVEGNNKGADDMRLMKHCRHNIMANSSFSWWGAWLNTNPDKIVIAPKIWFQDKKANEKIEIIPESWKRL